MQDAVNAKAHHALLAPRLEVNVAGALCVGVLQQPVDHAHDMLLVGIDGLAGLAEFDQLLEIVDARFVIRILVGALDRLGQREKLAGVARDVCRVGHHAANR